MNDASEQEIIDKATDLAADVRHKAANLATEVLMEAEMAAINLKETTDANPSNRELQRSIEAQNKMFADHARDDIAQFAAIHAHISNLPRKEDIEQIFHDVMKQYLLNSGGKIKTGIMITATIIGSLLVIFGGLRTFLGWIGFQYLK